MSLDLLYNTTSEVIRLPEYGRTIQGLLQHAKTITDPRKRQKTVEAIVNMMMVVNPTNRNQEDYREKLWNHAFRIANYELDIILPPGITIRREEDKPKPQHMGYPKITQRFRHYGYNVQALMQKAIEMPDGPKREGFVEVIASYMKLAYKTWNKEHYVSDDVVKDDLEIISDGQLELHEGHSSLDVLAYSARGKDQDHKRSRSGGRRQPQGNDRSGGSARRERGSRGGSNSGGTRGSGGSGGGRRRK